MPAGVAPAVVPATSMQVSQGRTKEHYRRGFHHIASFLLQIGNNGEQSRAVADCQAPYVQHAQKHLAIADDPGATEFTDPALL